MNFATVRAYAIRPDCAYFTAFVRMFALLIWCVHAAAYRAYAIRPYKWRKTKAPKNTFDVGKTT